MLTVRRAKIEDIPIIMQFLEEHWLHGYALAHDRAFFDWQFVKDGLVNIWIGIDDDIGKLYAMQSEIFYRQTEHPDMSGSIWLAIKSSNPLLAFEVQDYMWAEMQPRDTFSPGLRPDAVNIYKALGSTIVAMDHFYRLNNLDIYNIAVVKDKSIPPSHSSGYKVSPIHDIEEMKAIISEEALITAIPSKDYAYIRWRYFQHPIFHYDIWKITNAKGSPCAVLITRTEKANGSSSCKIIDFYGDFNAFSHLSSELDRLMVENDYEFIDVYSYGVPTTIYEKAGMIRCDKDSVNIIPNYFQPYEAVNADIYLVPPSIPDAKLFRGDSDQDKPRLLNI